MDKRKLAKLGYVAAAGASFLFSISLWFEVLPVSGTGESLILSHRKDLEDGSEEDRIEVKRHTSALHR